MSEITARENSAQPYLGFAQISDCHLYASKDALHYGVNVYQNLKRVLTELNKQTALKFVVFTGDLTQDHSEQSYLNFVDALVESQLTLPIYYTPGNHDQPELLNRLLALDNIHHTVTVDFPDWQIQLVNSKSDSPAGYVSNTEGQRLLSAITQDKYQLVLMHHHAVDVGYFIDRHGLENKTEFYALLDNIAKLKALACGHVHNALQLTIAIEHNQVPLYSCPATSIQFDKNFDGVANSGLASGYRVFRLYPSGAVESDAIFLATNH